MLWAILLGDEIQNLYHNLIGYNFLIAALFCYSWTFFSNNCIMPSFLAITEDGYIQQSKTSKFAWLSDDLQDPDENTIIGDEDDEGQPELTCEQFLQKVKKTNLFATSSMINWQGEDTSEFH